MSELQQQEQQQESPATFDEQVSRGIDGFEFKSEEEWQATVQRIRKKHEKRNNNNRKPAAMAPSLEPKKNACGKESNKDSEVNSGTNKSNQSLEKPHTRKPVHSFSPKYQEMIEVGVKEAVSKSHINQDEKVEEERGGKGTRSNSSQRSISSSISSTS